MRSLLIALALFSPPQNAPFELKDGDRVALVGDTFVEREQTYGHIESMLTRRFPDRNVVYRNLGWSADTVLGRSRAGFDPGEKGFDRLKEQVAAVNPTVIVIGHGMAASFGGESGLSLFSKDLNTLLDALSQGRSVRFVLVGPSRHEKLPAPLPDPAKHNEDLARYSAAMKSVADLRSIPFVPLYDLLKPATDNGIHLSDLGYRRAADAVAKGLGWEPDLWRVEIDAAGKVVDSRGATVSDAAPGRFKARDARLPAGRVLVARGLKEKTGLAVDGTVVAEASPAEWEKGVAFEAPQEAELRQRIVRKNELYFHRYRPANNTYLFLFRKHEQGRNAKEMPMFDPLIEKEESEIAKLRAPGEHAYELRPGASVPPPAARPVEKPLPSTLPPPTFEVAEGFEISLFAEAPLITKPIQMNFDPQGRLWVAGSAVYPQIEPGAAANDKIFILEDTDGDGRADKSTVFADGLLIPTAVEPGDGGCYVGASTELLHLADTDGDGKADRRRIILCGFGTEDTHHVIHTLRWAPDGQLYFNQSVYIHTHLETPHGVARMNSGGIWRLRPSTMEAAPFSHGLWNPWGHQVDEFGQSFATDGAGGTGLNWVMPGATFEALEGGRRVCPGVSPGSYPKFCSHEFLSGRHLPDDWQGDVLANDFRASRVWRFKLREEGSAYVAQPMGDLVRSRDNWFRPIDVKMGPDGAIYIADWSNPIINHGEVDFRDPRRDHVNGRIWRVTAKGRPLVARPKLDGADADLLERFKDPELYTRHKARRVLTERGAKIVPALAAWAKAQTDERLRLEALWLYQSIGVVEPELLKSLLEAKDARVRAAATRVLYYWRLPEAADLLAARLDDEHPRVRVEAMRSLSRIPSARAAALVLAQAEKTLDKHAEFALWLTVNDLAETWLAALSSGEWKAEGKEKQLSYALRAIHPRLGQQALQIAKAGHQMPRDGSGPAVQVIASSGGPDELRGLLDLVLAGSFDPPGQARVLAALGEAARLRGAIPGGNLNALGSLVASDDAAVRREALRLAGRWKVAQFIPELAKAAAALEDVGFDGLRELRARPATLEALRDLSGKERPWAVRARAAEILFKPEEVAEVLASAPDEAAALGLWRGLLTNRGIGALAAALPALPEHVTRAGLRALGETGRAEPELTKKLALEVRELGDAELKELAAKAAKEGDSARGEAIFHRKDTACVTCHAISGAGGRVGPDLGSLGASAPPDYVVESLLYPNRKVKENFHSVIVQTKDGDVISGVPVRENEQEIILRSVEDRELSIPKRSVQQKKNGLSLMPANVASGLKPAELLDLVRFLTELGRPGAYDTSKPHVPRMWTVGDARVAAWADGRLAGSDASRGTATTKFRVAAAGKVRFKSSAPAQVDGQPLGADGSIDLAAGTHALTVQLGGADVRVSSADVVFLSEP